MLNIIKMDLYRMFHTKSFYVIGIILLAAIIFTTVFANVGEEVTSSQVAEEEIIEQAEDAQINIGMSVVVPTKPGEKITVFDMLFANTQAKFLALFMTIFTVLFSTADISSGYIKTIGGQVKNRARLVLSKAIILSIYTVLLMLFVVVTQCLANLCAFGYLELGNVKDLLMYVGTQTILHVALVLVAMMIAIVLRNNLVSMIIVVCVCMNLMTLIYLGIDTILGKLGVNDFSVMEYTVTGRISMLSMTPDNEECIISVVVALIFGTVATTLASVIFKKRDV